MRKFLSNSIPLKECPNCNHRYGLDSIKRFDGTERSRYFRIICKSCNLSTNEFRIIEEAKLEWNK
ncbi:hypothetical protein CH367_08915 [Leptospira barantonii]|uniref:Restriction alleviation protein, Lar family n=1 Tax=Leptospira barantonii TaxID=2023184 RepID=A0ABX4NMD2_9LEPT|nr:hypothetical protein CH367_08915 [Leptospira barantonii]